LPPAGAPMYAMKTRNRRVLIAAPRVMSKRNLIKILVLLTWTADLCACGFSFLFSDFGRSVFEGTLVGKLSSRKFCHTMLGGLLIMLKRPNFPTGAGLRERGT